MPPARRPARPPPTGWGGAGFELLGERGIERRDRQANRRRLVAGEVGQEILVTGDKVVFGDDHDRIAVLGEHFQASPGEPQLPLDGLVAIRDAAERHHARLPAPMVEFTPQQFRRVVLDHDARLESLNPAYAPIPWNEEARIQGVFEGRFNPAHKA